MADRPNRLGQQLGNYRLVRLLGQGGFAEVYLGEHTYLGTHAAIKILHTRVAQDDDIALFQQEARMLANLVHPHIVRVLDFGADNQTPYLVMSSPIAGILIWWMRWRGHLIADTSPRVAGRRTPQFRYGMRPVAVMSLPIVGILVGWVRYRGHQMEHASLQEARMQRCRCGWRHDGRSCLIALAWARCMTRRGPKTVLPSSHGG